MHGAALSGSQAGGPARCHGVPAGRACANTAASGPLRHGPLWTPRWLLQPGIPRDRGEEVVGSAAGWRTLALVPREGW